MKRKGVTFIGKMPELREPYLVTSFAGWLDAGQVATGSMTHMIRTWRAKRFVEIKSEDYCLFTSLRPEVVIDEGLVSYLRFPRSSFFWHRSKTGKHDLIFFRGVEPDLNPQKYVDTVLDIAETFNVSRIYSIGGFYDQIPHTRAPRISGIVSKPDLSQLLTKNNVTPLTYEGPASIHSFLLASCHARSMEAVSLLAHVPFYLKVETNPSVCLGLLQKLLEMLEVKIDLSELADSAIGLK
jgi:proteasome assembly chaperone (PAC2) family protein